MKTLLELNTILNKLLLEKNNLTLEYSKKMNLINDEIKKINDNIYLFSHNIDVSKLELGQKILSIGFHRNYYKKEFYMINSQLIDDCKTDILNNFKRLKEEYFGYKEYDGYYQRSDHNYGYGPSHGSIVESIGLNKDYRNKETFTDEEKEACFYLLENLKYLLDNLNRNAKEKGK